MSIVKRIVTSIRSTLKQDVRVLLGGDPLELKVREVQAQKAELQAKAKLALEKAARQERAVSKANAAVVGLARAKSALDLAVKRETEAQNRYDAVAESIDDRINAILYPEAPIEVVKPPRKTKAKAEETVVSPLKATKPTTKKRKSSVVPAEPLRTLKSAPRKHEEEDWCEGEAIEVPDFPDDPWEPKYREEEE
jgi:hypothetical protein